MAQHLKNICIPLTVWEVELLLQNFILWDNFLFNQDTPSGCKLIISVSTEFEEETRSRIESIYDTCTNVKNLFGEPAFIECKLSKEEDLYHKVPKKGMSYPFGLKSGPNNQFFKTMNVIYDQYNGPTFYMETDCIILQDDFIQKIDEEIARHPGFFVLGSIYYGVGKLNSKILQHLNGNAIYNAGSEEFNKFMNEVWKPVTYEIASEFPQIAYDIAIEYALSSGMIENYDEIKSKFIVTSLLQNHGGEPDYQRKGLSFHEIISESEGLRVLHGRQLIKEFIEEKAKGRSIEDIPKNENATRPIFIYQMGKVGSSFVYNLLRKNYPLRKVLHLHSLNEQNLKEYRDELTKMNLLNNDHRHFFQESFEGVRILKEERELDIITMTREPVQRSLSAFFENLGHHIFQSDINIPLFRFHDDNTRVISNAFKHNVADSNVLAQLADVSTLINDQDFANYSDLDAFLTSQLGDTQTEHYKRTFYKFGYNGDIIDELIRIYKESNNFDETLEWFEKEFSRCLGINIYDLPFNKERGYQYLKISGNRILIFQAEIDDSRKISFLKKYYPKLGQNTEQVAGNISGQKHYAQLYSRFKKKMTFAEEELDRIYTSKYVQHFYGIEQIREFYEQYGVVQPAIDASAS